MYLDLWEIQNGHKTLPWQCSPSLRKDEDVRPIFWSTRPKSYVCRTSEWDQFPNGRWGNSSAPSFGDLKDYHIFYQKLDKQVLISELGESLNNEKDVWDIFALFVSGKQNTKGHVVSSLCQY